MPRLAAAGGTRQEMAGMNPAYIPPRLVARVRQASPAGPPPLHATSGGGWRYASGDGRNESGLHPTSSSSAGEAGLPRGTPSVAGHVWRWLEVRVRRRPE